jgi:hypothetical protein
MGPGMRERDTLYRWWLCLGSLACASTPAAVEPSSSPVDDAKAVMAQELGEQPPPEGPCPERGVAHVLENPRAAVHRTALGLAYCMLQEGPADAGVVPGPADVVKVHYSGWTEEGEMFDSSLERGEPMDFPLNGVIRGWGEGLRLMTPGDKARLWIPGNLGYGRRLPGEVAGSPPKGTLIFEVELLGVDRAPPTAPTANAEGAPKNEEDDAKPRLLPRKVESDEDKPNGLGHRRRKPSSSQE